MIGLAGAAAPAAAQDSPIGPAAAATLSLEPFQQAIETAKQSMMSSPSEALRSARSAGQIARDAKGTEGEVKRITAAWLEGEALTRLNHPDQAEPILTRALARIEKAGPRSKLHADLLKSHASVAGLTGDIARAMHELQRAYSMYRSLGEARSQSIVLQNIGSIYSDANDHLQALRYYTLAQDAYTQDPMMVLAAQNNRGNTFKTLGRYDAAEAAYRTALRAAHDTGSPLLQARIFTNIASAQLLKGDLDRAEATVRRGLALANGEAADWRPFLWGVKAQVAHARGDDAQAGLYLARTFAGQDPSRTTTLFRDFHETAYEVSSNRGDFAVALAHLQALKRLDDESRETAASTNFALMSARFNNDIQQLKLEKSKDDLQRVTHLATAGGVALLCVILAISYGLLMARRSRREVDAANALLTHAARYDVLTGLANRPHLRHLLGEAIAGSVANGTESGLLLIDLDRFKQVNDTHGHAGGDRLLELVAERLRKATGALGEPARLGGDEFAVPVPRATAPAVMQELADTIVRDLSRPFDIFGSTVEIGGSVGFAISPEDGDTVDLVVRNADLALYEAKRRGRGRACRYNAWMTKTAAEAGQLEQELRTAMAEGELRLAFQPITCARTGELRSREALLRWTHPTRGEIAPAEFVALAESSGLIAPIGAWVLHEACRAAAEWPADVRVAVNVSVAQLKNAGLVSTVVNALAASGLAPERLELEITESLFLFREDRAIETLCQLRQLGVSLSLDDFGTGFSSLSYLQRGVFSRLKIDQSVVHRLANGDADCGAIVRGIVDLARNFDMETVAEGVENPAHCKLMTEIGCTYLQGFYIGQPQENMARAAEPEADDKRWTGTAA